MWSMSTSEAAVQVAPSYGENHVPEVAAQALSTTTLVPSRFRTYSLVTDRLVLRQCREEEEKKRLPRVAGSADSRPGREQVTGIRPVIDSSLDGKSSQLALGGCGRRNSRLRACVSGVAQPQADVDVSDRLTGVGAGIGVAATAAIKSEPTMIDFILLSVELMNDELISLSVSLILESRNTGHCWLINSQTA